MQSERQTIIDMMTDIQNRLNKGEIEEAIQRVGWYKDILTDAEQKEKTLAESDQAIPQAS